MMFRKALELNPTYTEAYFNIGQSSCNSVVDDPRNGVTYTMPLYISVASVSLLV